MDNGREKFLELIKAQSKHYKAGLDLAQLELETVREQLSDTRTALDNERSNELMTRVQRVAIETVLDVHKYDFEGLLSAANVKPHTAKTMDNLTYVDAVSLIMFGNNISPRATLERQVLIEEDISHPQLVEAEKEGGEPLTEIQRAALHILIDNYSFEQAKTTLEGKGELQ